MADARTEIATAGKVALASLQATAQTYTAQNPLAPHIMASIDAAGERAHAHLASLNEVDPSHVATTVLAAMQEVAAVAGALPPGVIPPVAQAAIMAFSALSRIAGPAIIDVIKAHHAAAAPDATQAPVSPDAPLANAPLTPPTVPTGHPDPEPHEADRYEPPHPPVHAGSPRH
jgi:hypothetical protein